MRITIYSLFIGFILYLIGFRIIRAVLRGYLQRKHVNLLLQLLVFVFILIGFSFSQIQELGNFKFIGAIFIVLAINVLSLLLNEMTPSDNDLIKYFGDEWKDILKDLPLNKEVNRRILNRSVSILRNRGQIEKTKGQQTVVFKRKLDENIWAYDSEDYFSYKIDNQVKINLEIEVLPDLIYKIPSESRKKNVPIKYDYSQEKDKWIISYWAQMEFEKLNF